MASRTGKGVSTRGCPPGPWPSSLCSSPSSGRKYKTPGRRPFTLRPWAGLRSIQVKPRPLPGPAKDQPLTTQTVAGAGATGGALKDHALYHVASLQLSCMASARLRTQSRLVLLSRTCLTAHTVCHAGPCLAPQAPQGFPHCFRNMAAQPEQSPEHGESCRGMVPTSHGLHGNLSKRLQ